MLEASATARLIRAYGGDSPQAAMRHAVDRLLARAEVNSPPAALELLASLRGVERIEAVEMAGAGHLVPLETGGYLIQVNVSEGPARQRFSMAHEICHTFFDELRRSGDEGHDVAFALDSGMDEESLCDVGAAHMLLHPNWLRPIAAGREPSLDALYEVASTCDTSVEAAALQLAALTLWPCSFVYWEPGYRESERRQIDARGVRSAPAVVQPAAKLRAQRVYACSGAPFFPRSKSVENDSSIAQALHRKDRSSGRERFWLGSRLLEADCESDYAGYTDATGAEVQRVLTVMCWLH